MKVSCIVPTYNRPEMLRNSIRMFLNQTYLDIEMVIVDDSDKPSFELAPHDRIKYIYLPERRSIGYKRNMAIKACTGQWIAFWDDDDIHCPERIANLIQRAKETRCDVIADANHVYRINNRFYTLRDRPDIQERLWWQRLLMPSVMFKKSLTKYARFPNRYTSEDREFFKAVIKACPKPVKFELWKSGMSDFVYHIHNTKNSWSRYMAHMISVTKPYSKHCLCVR